MTHMNERKTTVQGKTYTVWADYIRRGMFAMNEAGEVRCIHGSGYMTKDLTIRKAIANTFGLESFRM